MIEIHNNYIPCCYQSHQRWYQFRQEIFGAFVSPSECMRKIWLQYKHWEKWGHLPSSIPCPTSSGFSQKMLVQMQKAAWLQKESIIEKRPLKFAKMVTEIIDIKNFCIHLITYKFMNSHHEMMFFKNSEVSLSWAQNI